MCACSHACKQATTLGIFSVSTTWVLGIGLWWSGGAASTLVPLNYLPTLTLLGECTGSLTGNRNLPTSLGWLASEPQGSAVSASPALGLQVHFQQAAPRFSTALLPPSFSRWRKAVVYYPDLVHAPLFSFINTIPSSHPKHPLLDPTSWLLQDSSRFTTLKTQFLISTTSPKHNSAQFQGLPILYLPVA